MPMNMMYIFFDLCRYSGMFADLYLKQNSYSISVYWLVKINSNKKAHDCSEINKKRVMNDSISICFHGCQMKCIIVARQRALNTRRCHETLFQYMLNVLY